MKKLEHHKEIPVKVTAWVDEGIAPLVGALNEIPGVLTIDSCQGRQGEPANVYFRFNGPPSATLKGVHSIARALGRSVECEWSIDIRYWGSYDPIACIKTAPEDVQCLATAIRSYRKD